MIRGFNMAIQNNPWSSWSQDLNSGFQFEKDVVNQSSTIANQIQSLIDKLNNKTITMGQFQTDVAPIVSSMNNYINGLNSQYSGIAASPVYQQVLSNLNASWQGTLQTITNTGVTLNPTGQGNITITTNSDGSESVTFTSSVVYDPGNGYDQMYYLTGFGSRNSEFPYVPGEEDDEGNGPGSMFGYFVLAAVAYPGVPQQFNWNCTPPETVVVTSDSNKIVTVTITITPTENDPNPFNASMNPSVSSLSSFASNPFAAPSN